METYNGIGSAGEIRIEMSGDPNGNCRTMEVHCSGGQFSTQYWPSGETRDLSFSIRGNFEMRELVEAMSRAIGGPYQHCGWVCKEEPVMSDQSATV